MSISPVWVIRAMNSRSKRSAKTPAKGAKITAGTASATTIMPTKVGDFVSSQVNHPTAVRWNHRVRIMSFAVSDTVMRAKWRVSIASAASSVPTIEPSWIARSATSGAGMAPAVFW